MWEQESTEKCYAAVTTGWLLYLSTFWQTSSCSWSMAKSCRTGLIRICSRTGNTHFPYQWWHQTTSLIPKMLCLSFHIDWNSRGGTGNKCVELADSWHSQAVCGYHLTEHWRQRNLAEIICPFSCDLIIIHESSLIQLMHLMHTQCIMDTNYQLIASRYKYVFIY